MNKLNTKILFGAIFTWLIVSVLPGASQLRAAELIMMEQDYCTWCERWHDEIGGIYDKTSEGKLAPLRRFNIDEPLPREYAGLDDVFFTPTFILWDEGKEISRLRGYPGDEFFWYLLGEMLEKLPKSDK